MNDSMTLAPLECSLPLSVYRFQFKQHNSLNKFKIVYSSLLSSQKRILDCILKRKGKRETILPILRSDI